MSLCSSLRSPRLCSTLVSWERVQLAELVSRGTRGRLFQATVDNQGRYMLRRLNLEYISTRKPQALLRETTELRQLFHPHLLNIVGLATDAAGVNWGVLMESMPRTLEQVASRVTRRFQAPSLAPGISPPPPLLCSAPLSSQKTFPPSLRG